MPFCGTAKCAYCAFYSVPGADDKLKTEYLEKLESEFQANEKNTALLESIYIGGGTPTILSGSQLETLFTLIKKYFRLAPGAEISIECNPESLTEEKAEIIAAFANRASIGLQTFDPVHRSTIGRSGEAEKVYGALELFRKYGIENIGLDLIYAIPGQTIDSWLCDLKKACELNPRHISAYSLTLEEGTKLAAGKNIALPPEDISALFWTETGKFLQSQGLERYEISNYSQKNFHCAHNLNIWYGDTYLGCGPAAASFDGLRRWTNPADINEWLAGKSPDFDVIAEKERAKEIFIFGLRTAAGWNSDTFREKTGFDFTKWLSALPAEAKDSLYVFENNIFKLTQDGLMLCDEIAELLL